MDTNTVTQTIIERRELWLTIALAVARDNLPEPEISHGDGVSSDTRYMYLQFYRHSDAIRWANHLDPNPVIVYSERPDLGNRYAKAEIVRDGWRIYIVGIEPIESSHPELAAAIVWQLEGRHDAARVVEAVLTPDVEAVA